MRCTWLAKQAPTTRGPAVPRKILGPPRPTGLSLPRQLRVRRVCEQEADAFGGGDLPNSGEIRPTPVHRSQVQLEVAAVEHDALGRVEGKRKTARYRVRHRD